VELGELYVSAQWWQAGVLVCAFVELYLQQHQRGTDGGPFVFAPLRFKEICVQVWEDYRVTPGLLRGKVYRCASGLSQLRGITAMYRMSARPAPTRLPSTSLPASPLCLSAPTIHGRGRCGVILLHLWKKGAPVSQPSQQLPTLESIMAWKSPWRPKIWQRQQAYKLPTHIVNPKWLNTFAQGP